MDCREAEGRLYEYIDREMPKDEEKELVEHISECSECKDRYEELLKYNSLVGCIFMEEGVLDMDFKDNIMNAISKEKTPKKHWYMRFSRHAVAACVAIVCILGSVIPWNGKSFAASIGEWVKFLSFKSKGIQYEINTETAKEFYKENQGKTGIKLANKKTGYKTPKEAKENIPVPVFIPDYTPKGFKLDRIYHIQHYDPLRKDANNIKNIELEDHGVVSLKYYGETIEIKNKNSSGEDNPIHRTNSIDVDYVYSKGITDKVIGMTNKDTKLKQVNVLDHYGYITLDTYDDINNKDSNCINVRDLHIRLTKFDLNIFLISYYKVNPEFEKIADDELVKMAESIIKQVK